MLLGLLFQVAVAVFALPHALLITLLSFGNPARRGFLWSFTLEQMLISIVYAGLIGLLAHTYAFQSSIFAFCFYALSGFIATWFTVGLNIHTKAKSVQSLQGVPNAEPWKLPVREAYARGAEFGAALASFVVYPAVFLWPQTVASIPGAQALYTALFALAAWISEFSLVRLLLIVLAVAYIVSTGLTASVTGMLLVGRMRRGHRRVES